MTRVIVLSLLALAAVVRASDQSALIAGVFTPARVAPDFSMRGSDGSELTLRSYRGKVVLLSFGYTSCTEVCPLTLAIWRPRASSWGRRPVGCR